MTETEIAEAWRWFQNWYVNNQMTEMVYDEAGR